MEIEIQTVVALITGLGGAAATLFTLWYKINRDITTAIERAQKDADAKSDALRKDFDAKIELVRREVSLETNALQTDLRSFRGEMRDDIRSLNSTITARFDAIIQQMLSSKTSQA